MNWEAFPFEPQQLDAVALTHAHLDHSGAPPLLEMEVVDRHTLDELLRAAARAAPNAVATASAPEVAA